MFYNILYKIFTSECALFHVFKYVSFRSIGACLTSLAISLLIGGKVINFLKKMQKNGQPIRTNGPESHIDRKKGTPTMGGIMIIISLCFSSILWSDLSNIKVLMCLFVVLGFGAIGAVDDYYKLKFNNCVGLSAKKKLFYQILIACISCFVVYSTTYCPDATTIFLPIFKNITIDLGVFMILWIICVIIGSSNAVNLTDGLDGLAIGPVFVCSICMAIISYLVGNHVFSEYLHIKYIPGSEELSVILSSLVGASLGFLWFNAPPAKVFMGDTGSISIGGLLGFVAVLTKHEIVFAILGGIFVLEAGSVILQVIIYKTTKKRIFLMAPIHHHFEKKGWPESTIVFRFWIITLILGIIGLATIKLR